MSLHIHLLFFSIKHLGRGHPSGHVVDAERVHSGSAVRPELENESVEGVRVAIKRFQNHHFGARRKVLVQTHRVGRALVKTQNKKKIMQACELTSCNYTG